MTIKTDISEEAIRSIHEFAKEIAHQLRNPLGSIELFASLLLKDHRSERDRKRISQIIKAVRIIERRLSEFMMSSKTQSIPMEVIHLNGFIKETIGFAKYMNEDDNLFLSVKYGATDPCIRGNRDMLKHLFICLVFNALRNLPEGWHLEFEIGSDDAASCPTHVPREDDFVHVTLKAMGRGKQKSKGLHSPVDIFFPRIPKNTSLGLSVLHSMVGFHEGFFSLKDEGSGTMSIQISLPRYSTV